MDAHRSAEQQNQDPELIIPGSPERLADETARISPENRPADPKLGPKALRLEIVGLWVVVLILSVCLAIWVNVFAGVAALAIGTIGVLFNPVVHASEQRAEERRAVVRKNTSKFEPGDVVVRQGKTRADAGRTP